MCSHRQVHEAEQEAIRGHFDGSIVGPGFTAAISLTSNGHRQAVSVRPQGGDINDVANRAGAALTPLFHSQRATRRGLEFSVRRFAWRSRRPLSDAAPALVTTPS